MKNLILILFAILTISFISNAQDLSFKSFDKSLEPKGELVVVEKEGDNEDYYYQEWGEHSLTQWEFRYKSAVYRVFEEKAYYDELELERADIKKETQSYHVWIPTKKDNYAIFNGDYKKDEYTHQSSPYIVLRVKTKKEADDLLTKLKEKAFDMSLDLDAKVERISSYKGIVFNEQFPNGINEKELSKMKRSETEVAQTETKSESSDSSVETSPSSNTSNNSASNNSAPKEKTEISLRLWNKSDGEIDISYEHRGAGGSKTQTSISRRSTKSVKMKVGGRVFGANGAVLLTVTAAMDDTEQVIFK
ncbi:MAG: hypothetical protein K1X72_25765 [Pyrinomonadaceae bacterium]|nr:hypothetical protein [Pyrinomonadaceae bacterium]